MPPSKPYAVVIGLHPTGLGVIRSLTKEGVPCIALFDDPRPASTATRLCHRKIQCQVTDSAELVRALEALGRQLDEPAVLFPCGDTDVLVVSQHRDVLSPWFRIVLPSHENLRTLIDKTEFTHAALAGGLPIPPTSVVASTDDLDAAVARARYPCLVKPWRNTRQWEGVTGSQKAIWVHSGDELRSLYAHVSPVEPRILVQDWIAGRDDDIYATFVCFDRDSKPIASFTSRKIRQWPPLTGSTSATAPFVDADLEQRTIAILQQFEFQGLGSIEWKRDARTGQLMIVEPTVGRNDLNSPVALLWGLNVPFVAYCDAAGLPLPVVQLEPRAGCWIHEDFELQSMLYYLGRHELTLEGWWRSLPGMPIFAFWSWRDPMPGIVWGWSVVDRAVRKGWRRVAGRRPSADADQRSLSGSAAGEVPSALE